MTKTLHDALVEAAGSRPFLPPEREIALRCRRQRRHAALLGACVVTCVVALLAATVALPGRSRRVIIEPARPHPDVARPSEKLTSGALPPTPGPAVAPSAPQQVAPSPPTTAMPLAAPRPVVNQFEVGHAQLVAPVPAGLRVAFLSGNEIDTMNLDGSDRRALVEKTADTLFAWSPDRRWLAVRISGALMLLDVTTGETRTLRDHFGFTPAWASFSPDSRSIAFTLSNSPSSYGELWIAALDGLETHSLPATGDAVSWAPSGDWLAYSDCGGSGFDVCLIKPDGTGAHALPHDVQLRHVAWSPDGSSLAGLAQTAGASGDSTYFVVAVAKLDGSGQRIVDSQDAVNPMMGPIQWTPDGRSLVFESPNVPATSTSQDLACWTTACGAPPQEGIVRIGADGSGRTTLPSPWDHANPVVSPR